MKLTAAPETVLPGRRRGHSAGNDFWITAYMGANRYDSGGTPPPSAGALYPGPRLRRAGALPSGGPVPGGGGGGGEAGHA